MKIALTGGTGFIGRRVVRMLCARGDQVTCVVRNPNAAAPLAALGATLVPGDILDRQSLDRAFEGKEAVLHLAASYQVGLSGAAAAGAMRQNVEGTRNALEAAVDAGARKIVYTSSYVVFGTTGGQIADETFTPGPLTSPHPHASTYTLSKARAHLEVAAPMMQAGAPIVAVMPAAVLGPGDTSGFNDIFIELAAGRPLFLGAAKYGVVSVEDCARGHLFALDRGKVGRSYLLINENPSLEELARKALEVSGVRGRVVVLPDWFFTLSAACMSAVERVLPVPRMFSSETSRGVQSRTTMTYDHRRAREELGWIPEPIDGTLREIMAYELARRRKPPPELLAGVTPRL